MNQKADKRNLADSEVLEVLLKVVEQEAVLYERAKAQGHEISWDEDSKYFLYFGELLEEMGPKGVMDFLRETSIEKRREYWDKFLKFEEFMENFKKENKGREIWFVGGF